MLPVCNPCHHMLATRLTATLLYHLMAIYTVQALKDLIRWNKQAGTLLLLWPCWWGLALANAGAPPPWRLFLLFAIGALMMRSAGCIINDLWDRHVDLEVARTRNRPLATGALSVTTALIVLAVLLSLGLLVLLELSQSTIILGLAVMPLVVLYPLAKRVFFAPQLVLGLVFNVGILLGWQEVQGQLALSAWYLFAAGILWTLAYDTVYGLQDVIDDKKLHLQSTSRWMQPHIKIWLTCLYITMLLLMLYAIYMATEQLRLLSVFYLAFSFIPMLLMVRLLDFRDAAHCARFFRLNAYMGGNIFIALLLA